MNVRTTLVLDDGTELVLDAKQAAYVGLQCPRCMATFEISGQNTDAEARQVVELQQQHVVACGKRPRLTQ